ncbi:MAG TPA: glycosyltransferase family 2 protein [Candidatus Elarobacter sp.]|jgi:GT2 family glycosyltransferase
MTGGRAFAIVCAGGGPRAAAALRARFPGVPFRYAGPPGSAPYGVVADPSPAAALRRVDAEYAIVVDPAVALDPATAQRLLAIVEGDAVAAPMLVGRDALVVSAGTVLEADAVRGGARAHAVAAGAETSNVRELPAPDALDGRCLAARTAALRAMAPESCDADAWSTATATARRRGARLAVGRVTVPVDAGAVAPHGDDPRRAEHETALFAHATTPWRAFAADAASGHVRRTVRAAYGNDVHVVESTPPVAVVVVGTPADAEAFERDVRANAIVPAEIQYAGGSPDGASHASGPDALDVANRALRVRGDRYVAFVDARAGLRTGWLDALTAALERDPLAAFATFAPSGCDARATLVAANRIPLADRLAAFETLHGALGDLMLRVARERGRGVVRVPAANLCTLPPPAHDVAFSVRYGVAPVDAVASRAAAAPRFSGIASIVMLSWNAPEYTKVAVESIRAHTRYPHEIVIVDNGSDAPALAVLDELARDHAVRVVKNGRNLGFGQGMNVGMAHARGDVVVILNNDVVVTDGWLEDLVGALETRRTVACSAPRSNRVASEQLVAAQYADLTAMHRFAADRRRAHRGRGYLAQRVVGFCLCLDRAAIEDVGGFDPLYGLGNYEDDDLCVRLRGAGWEIFVCDDVFIHHFGSVSFKANALDYRAHMQRNWDAFCTKWGMPPAPLSTEYDIRSLARPGFDPDVHFVPLPEIA